MQLFSFFIAKVQMFKFGLTCFKANKANYCIFFLILGNILLFHIVTIYCVTLGAVN